MNRVAGDIIPSSLRRALYIAFAIIGVGFGATQTAFVSAELAAPVWLTVAFQVYLYVGGAFGLLAAANTDTDQATEHYTENYTPVTNYTGKHADV